MLDACFVRDPGMPSRFERLLNNAKTSLKDGRLDEALSFIRSARAIRRSEPISLSVHVDILLRLDQIDEAYELLEHLIALRPTNRVVLANLAKVAKQKGGFELAAPYNQRLIQLLGERTRARFQAPLRFPGRMASALSDLRAGKIESLAEGLLLQKIERAKASNDQDLLAHCMSKGQRLFPKSVGIAFETARQFATRNYFGDALRSLEDLEERRGELPENLKIKYAYYLALNGQFTQSQDLLDNLSPESKGSDAYKYCQARLYYVSLRPEKALALLEAMETQTTDALLEKGRCMNALGKRNEAIAIFEELIARHPNYQPGYSLMMEQGALRSEDPRFQKVLEGAADPLRPTHDRTQFNFIAGRTLDREGRYDEAFDFFHKGNRLLDLEYDAHLTRQQMEEIKSVFSSDAFAADDPERGKGHVFVVGMPRSGTTLTEQILASHPQIHGVGESDWINHASSRLFAGWEGPELTASKATRALSQEHCREMASLYRQEILQDHPGAELIVDKMPTNFLHLGLIATLMPGAKIINCRRHPLDVCLSIFMRRFIGYHPYAYNLETLGQFYRSYSELMTHWEEVLPTPIHHFHYEDLVRNAREEVEKLLAFLGLAFHEDCMNFHKSGRAVITSSYAQVRSGLNDKSIGHWKHYAAHLTPLMEALGPTLLEGVVEKEAAA